MLVIARGDGHERKQKNGEQRWKFAFLIDSETIIWTSCLVRNRRTKHSPPCFVCQMPIAISGQACHSNDANMDRFCQLLSAEFKNRLSIDAISTDYWRIRGHVSHF